MKTLFVVIALLLVAAACGGESESVGTSAMPASKPAQGAPGTSAGQPTQTGGSGGTTIPNTVPTLQGPPVIRQAQLGLQVDYGSFGTKLSVVRTIVEADGGYIAGTDAQASSTSSVGTSPIHTGTINFMIPAASFDTAIDQISKVGTLTSEHITGTDVSAQYVDLRARLANAEAQRDAMLALLKQATNINDIIAVQNQIGQITSQIEQLKGQIKYLDDNTSYSSVTVIISEAAAPAQTSTDNWGFLTALTDAAHNFVSTINYVISGLGVIGPFLVLGLLGYLIWRRRRATAVPSRA